MLFRKSDELGNVPFLRRYAVVRPQAELRSAQLRSLPGWWRLLEMRDRIPGAAERMQHVAQVIARFDMRGIERDCFLVFRARFVETTERRKRNAEIVARLR
jgi:hypothetical protein